MEQPISKWLVVSSSWSECTGIVILYIVPLTALRCPTAIMEHQPNQKLALCICINWDQYIYTVHIWIYSIFEFVYKLRSIYVLYMNLFYFLRINFEIKPGVCQAQLPLRRLQAAHYLSVSARKLINHRLKSPIKIQDGITVIIRK